MWSTSLAKLLVLLIIINFFKYPRQLRSRGLKPKLKINADVRSLDQHYKYYRYIIIINNNNTVADLSESANNIIKSFVFHLFDENMLCAANFYLS